MTGLHGTLNRHADHCGVLDTRTQVFGQRFHIWLVQYCQMVSRKGVLLPWATQ